MLDREGDMVLLDDVWVGLDVQFQLNISTIAINRMQMSIIIQERCHNISLMLINSPNNCSLLLTKNIVIVVIWCYNM